MRVVMDSDCLVKLTKAGAKNAVTKSMEVHIPRRVMMETVREGKRRGFQDALEIEANIKKRWLRVIALMKRGRFPLASGAGEAEVLSLFRRGGYDALASDDQRFLKKLETVGIPYLTPTACILYVYLSGTNTKKEAFQLLQQLRSFISAEEYEMAKYYLETQS